MRSIALAWVVLAAAEESCFLSSCEDFTGFHTISLSNYSKQLGWLAGYEERVLAQIPNTDAHRLFEWVAEPSHWGDEATFKCAPHLVAQLQKELTSKGIDWRVVSENLEADLAAQRADYHASTLRPLSEQYDDWHTRHHPYNNIVEWLRTFERNHPGIVTMTQVGTTHQNRIIWGLILHGRQPRDPNKPKMVLDGSIHGQEKIGSATLQFTLDYLLQDYVAGVANIVELIDKVEVHFIPVYNPDGWEANNRKSRRPNPGSPCIGTDLNRNSPIGFGLAPGSSGDPCSAFFHGREPFSNVETSTIHRYTLGLRNVVATWAGHANSHFFGLAYGWTRNRNRHFDDNTAVADRQIAAMRAHPNCAITFRGGSTHGTSLFAVWGSQVSGTHPDAIFDLYQSDGVQTAKYTNLMEFPMTSGANIRRDGRCVYEATRVQLEVIVDEWYGEFD